MLRRLVLALPMVVLVVGCGSEEPLTSTRPADTGYVVTEVAVVDTGTAVVDSSEGGVEDTGSVMDSSRDTGESDAGGD
jgi:hypothetical protein